MKPKSALQTIELEPPLKVLLDEILKTDRHVQVLFPLLDLLTLPEDQQEGLVERLISLMSDLLETLRGIQTEQKGLKEAQLQADAAMQTRLEQLERMALRQTRMLETIMKDLGRPIE